MKTMCVFQTSLTRVLTITVTVTLTLTLLILFTGCQPKGSSAPGGEPDSTTGLLNGTLDGGGGNGINGRAMETYAVNIESLPEYRLYIAPLLRRMSMTSSPDVLLSYLQWAVKNKVWYLVPVALDELPQERVALGFRSDQLALHLGNEVFISKPAYDRITNKQKAHLLLHEMVMAARLLMKKSPDEQCIELSKNNFAQCSDPNLLRLARARNLTPADRRVLDGDDHSAVRSLTVYLMERDQDVSKTALRTTRLRLRFDFPWDHIVSEVTIEKLIKAFRAASFQGDRIVQTRPAPLEPLDCIFTNEWDTTGPIDFDFQNSSGIVFRTHFVEPLRTAVYPLENRPGINKQELPWGGLHNERNIITSKTSVISQDDLLRARGAIHPNDPHQIVDELIAIDSFHLQRNENGLIPRSTLPQPLSRMQILLSRDTEPRIISVTFTPVVAVLKSAVNEVFVRPSDLEYVPTSQPAEVCVNTSLTSNAASGVAPAVTPRAAASDASPPAPANAPSSATAPATVQ